MQRKFYYGAISYTSALATVLFEKENVIFGKFWTVTEQHQTQIYSETAQTIEGV